MTSDATRRGFLRLGAVTLSGLTLGTVQRLRAASPGPRPKSAIMIFLSGGPSHIDMYDLKPDAPAEYRGEFKPIKTNVPGIDVCELMPQQARLADKFTLLRGVQSTLLHTANEFYSGTPWMETPRSALPGLARRPALGSVVSRVRGAREAIPPYVSLGNRADWERAYYLGVEHEPFRVGFEAPREALNNLGRQGAVPPQRLDDRRELLRAFDTLRRDLDDRGTMPGMDGFQAQAMRMIVSGRVRDAFDVAKEPARLRERYGEPPCRVTDPCRSIAPYTLDHPGRALLRARRLVEAGVAVVTCSFYGYDSHHCNFAALRQLVPPLDQAVSALVGDLDARGLLDDVAVVMGGEFGRRPRVGDVTPDGRGHWTEAGCVWVAGGGLQVGKVIGATDARGERAVGPPIRMANVLATVYRVLGIDPAATFADFNGRPQHVLDDREPVRGLI